MSREMTQSKKTKPVRKGYRIQARDHTLELGSRTKIMGIINVTPDSFSHDGCLTNRKEGTVAAIKLALKMVKHGADILDIGGESSRPGAKKISLAEEEARVIPVIKVLANSCKIPISIDTYKTTIAQKALEAGASIVNTIKGCSLDKNFLKVIRNYNAAVVLMHMQGTPKTMQKKIFYQDMITDIKNALKKSIENCLENGIKFNKIIIDPGIGFGKTVEHNLQIINRLNVFHSLNQPVLIGTSRKSFIGKILDKEVPDRLMGTIVSVCLSIAKGAHIVRVHDVKQIKEAAKVADSIINETITY